MSMIKSGIYYGIIEKIFPNINIFITEDEETSKIILMPDINNILELKISISDFYYITIVKYQLELEIGWKLIKHRIFNGPIPSDSNFEPDFEFISQILKNYKSIG